MLCYFKETVGGTSAPLDTVSGLDVFERICF